MGLKRRVKQELTLALEATLLSRPTCKRARPFCSKLPLCYYITADHLHVVLSKTSKN